MTRLIEDVREGKLDFALTKPEDAQVLVSVREVRIWQAVDVVSGLIVLGVGLSRVTSSVGLADAAAFAVALVFGAVLIYCFWLVVATVAFWVVNMWHAVELFDGVFQTGRWPVGIYPGWLRYRRDVPRPDRLRGYGARRGAHVPARLADARACGRLHRRLLRLHALVLALRARALLGRLCLGRSLLESRGLCEATWPRAALPSGAFSIFKGGFMARPRTQSRTMVKSRDRATSSVTARRAVLKRIRDEGVEHVLFWFTDLEGHLKSFAITPSEMAEALNDGMGFDGSSITGFNAIEESDMVAIPDPASFQLMPRPLDDHGHPIGANVARMICDVVTPDGSPYEGDPRYVLRTALERMKGMGFDAFNVGPELEYFLFEDDKGTETIDEGGYFAMTAQDAATEVRNDTIHALEEVGIPIEYHHHEVGPSQHEIDMRYADALAMADYTITYRLIVKEVAAWHGYYATFMPKPLFGENGSGMHTHMSLFRGGRNQFFDRRDEHHLSKVAKSFIAGLLVHAREMAAVLAQWVNSYKRLVPGYEAPVYVAWSQRNRSALIRIPLYKPGSEQATRAEIRCPDPACNPYLAFAALLHAGLEGIEAGYELPDPMERNLYRLTRDRAARAGHRVAPRVARRGDRRARRL